jgi:PhoPQ-activated pathogenicity-related protein
MKSSVWGRGGLKWAALLGVLAGAIPARADLVNYVTMPDTAFAWKLMAKRTSGDTIIYELHLTSQVWQGIKWEHALQVFQPKGTEPCNTMLLWNTGGKPNPGDGLLAVELARKMKAPCAFLFGVPNQPLLDGKSEDALIAETFVRYLESGDGNWPLLFPMAKSVAKAMDALQEFSRQEWKKPLERFVIAGASKRGWTTWLTAASDARVKAIAPVVIDTLNMQVQLPHQLEALGAYSEMIHDYTERRLVPLPDTPRARKLWGMVDPWVYRERLTMPKFILNGANDPYWTTDALNLYWDDLKGPKWVLYVPNAGHNLQQRQGKGATSLSRAINGLAAYGRHQITGKPMPQLRWKHDDADGKLRLTVESNALAVGARLWVAEAPTLDFRNAEWKEHPLTVSGSGAVVALVPPPAKGCEAFFAELDYEIDGIPYHLSTQMRVAGKPTK